MKDTQPARVRFGVFELDLKTGELCAGDEKALLREQPLQILLMLVEREGEIVIREEIRKKLWPNDTIVEFDHSINSAITNLRRALDDSAHECRYIETVARRGYRLMVPVEWVGGDDSSGAVSAPSASSGRTLSPKPGDKGRAPAAQVASATDATGRVQPEAASLIGRTVSHYRVLNIIGGGGMGVVYCAEDLKLGRQVALKFLPENLGSDPQALERFSREARAASSLNHPNICTIYEFGEHEGQPFIVMELLEGQTLRGCLASGALRGTGPATRVATDRLLDIAIQICDGVEAAHERGIIHRDIKPANIFITAKGVAKILDFGVAKLVQTVEKEQAAAAVAGGSQSAAASSVIPNAEQSHAPNGAASGLQRDATHAQTDIAIGTVGYMSPEQVRGETLDARTDIFSFGVVLYEMASGQRAFGGETAVAVHGSILRYGPTPIREIESTLPPKLEAIVNKALEKDRDLRYQSVAQMRTELESLQGDAEPPVPLPPSVSRRRNGRLIMAALLVCVLAILGVLYWRADMAPVLTEKDSIVLADFTNSTSDPVFNDALNTALRVELEQTPFLNLLASDKVRGILKSLNRAENERLSPELARGVCLRSNSKAVVGGSVLDVGNRYRIELKATDCWSAKTLVATVMETASRDEIVKTLGIAGNDFRRKLGEPRDSLQRFNQPLEQTTSSSLEALQALSEGLEQKRLHGDAVALPHFKRAVELDPNFAQVYALLGVCLRNLAEVKPFMENLRKAYELRDRATQRQRFYIDGTYFRLATGDREKAIQSFTDWAKTYPRDPLAHANLSAVWKEAGQPEKGEVEARESVRLQPTAAAYADELGALLRADRVDDAGATLREAQALNISSHLMPLYQYMVSFLAGDTIATEEQVRSATGIPRGGLLCLHSFAQAFYGRFARERELLARRVALAKHDSDLDSAADCLAGDALQEVEVGNFARAQEQATTALALSTARDIQACTALVFARTGNLQEAEKLSQQLNQDYPQDTMMQSYSLPTIRAAIELQRNDPVGAIETLKVALPYELGGVSFASLYPAYIRGEAHLKAGQGQPAAMEFQKLLDHPGIVGTGVAGPLSRLQLGRAQAMMGDKAAAGKSYQDFLILWKDADPDIPILKQAKAEYGKLQ